MLPRIGQKYDCISKGINFTLMEHLPVITVFILWLFSFEEAIPVKGCISLRPPSLQPCKAGAF